MSESWLTSISAQSWQVSRSQSINQSIKLLFRLYLQRNEIRGAQILSVVMCHHRGQSRAPGCWGAWVGQQGQFRIYAKTTFLYQIRIYAKSIYVHALIAMEIFHYMRGWKTPTRMVSDMDAISTCIFNLCDVLLRIAITCIVLRGYLRGPP